MSTAGKVLTALILVVMAIWVVVLSGVTTLNVNWEQKIAQQEKQLKGLQDDAQKAAGDVIRLTEQARQEQDAAERDLAAILEQIATTERRQSATVESLTRLKVEVADYLAASERSQLHKTTREAEVAKSDEDLVKKRDEIAKAQALNTELREQLAKLEDEFKRITSENASQVEKAAGPRVRPASTTSTPPSP